MDMIAYRARDADFAGRTLGLHMIAASHFMHDVYGPFDASLHVTPPT